MRDFKIYIAFASVLLLAYLVVQYNQPKPVDWRPTLYYGDKIPFGTYVLHNQMQDIFHQDTIIHTNKSLYDEFHNDKPKAGNYIIIANNVEGTKNDYTELVKYISAGNSVFIAAASLDGKLADTLGIDIGVENYLLKKRYDRVTLQVNGKRKTYRFDKHTASNSFTSFDTSKATVMGQDSAGAANLLRFKLGKGNLFVSCNPELFTNYTLLKPEGADYAANVLSYLPPAKNIYWDQYQNGDIQQEQSPMRVLFTYPALQWAYYVSLAGLLLFVFYEMKRRQRIIPVVEPLKNSTLEFVKVVGQVYYENRDNANIAAKKILYWLSYLRDQYQLKTNKLDKEFMATLAQKTGIDPDFAADLVSFVNYLGVQTNVSDAELIKLNQLIEKFHTQS